MVKSCSQISKDFTDLRKTGHCHNNNNNNNNNKRVAGQAYIKYKTY